MPGLNFLTTSGFGGFFLKQKKEFTEDTIKLQAISSTASEAKENTKAKSKNIFKKLWGSIGNLLKNINLKVPNVFAGKNEASQSVGIAHHANNFNFEAEVGATRDNDESGRY